MVSGKKRYSRHKLVCSLSWFLILSQWSCGELVAAPDETVICNFHVNATARQCEIVNSAQRHQKKKGEGGAFPSEPRQVSLVFHALEWGLSCCIYLWTQVILRCKERNRIPVKTGCCPLLWPVLNKGKLLPDQLLKWLAELICTITH